MPKFSASTISVVTFVYGLLVDLVAIDETRRIEIIGTGNVFHDARRHFIGTVIIEPFVWHVFESR